jgi:hypothetical protein
MVHLVMDQHEDELIVPPSPTFPKKVLAAGVIWIVFGGWVSVIAAIVHSLERPGSPTPLSLWGFAFGAASIYIGIQTTRGAARGMRGSAFASMVFSFLILIHGISVIAAIQPEKGPEDMIGRILIAGGAVFAAIGFLAAGVLALWGQNEYRSWLQAQKG